MYLKLIFKVDFSESSYVIWTHLLGVLYPHIILIILDTNKTHNYPNIKYISLINGLLKFKNAFILPWTDI